MKRSKDGVPVFDVSDVGEMLDGEYFWFEAPMIDTCRPIFDDFEDNYDVELRLQKAGVIDGTCDCDSESCALVVRFNDMNHAEAFIERLNKYLTAKSSTAESLDSDGEMG